MCIEKSLFALSSLQVCPLSQVKYLLSISEYKCSVLESCEGYGREASVLVERAGSLRSENPMCVREEDTWWPQLGAGSRLQESQGPVGWKNEERRFGVKDLNSLGAWRA